MKIKAINDASLAYLALFSSFFPSLFSMFLTIMITQPSELRPFLPTHGVSRDDIFSVCGDGMIGPVWNHGLSVSDERVNR